MSSRGAPATEEPLVTGLREQRAEAVERVQAEHGAFLFNLAYRMLGDRQAAEDVVQETLVRAWTSLPAARPLNLRAWLATVDTRLCLNELRRRRRHPASALEEVAAEGRPADEVLPDPHPLADPYRAVAAGFTRQRVEEAIAGLPGPLRAALVLRALHGLDYRAIGAVLGCSEGAARVKVHRARQRCQDGLLGPASAVPLGPGCAPFRGRIAAWVEGELGPGAAADVAAHVVGCPLCQQVQERQETARSAWALLPWLPFAGRPPGLPAPGGAGWPARWKRLFGRRHVPWGEAARRGVAAALLGACAAGGVTVAALHAGPAARPPRTPVEQPAPAGSAVPRGPLPRGGFSPPPGSPAPAAPAAPRPGLRAVGLSVSAAPATATRAGAAVTLTATLRPPVGGGIVLWSGAGGAGLAWPPRTCRPARGSCRIVWRPRQPGPWRIVASWSGGGRYRPVSGAVSLQVLPAAGPVPPAAQAPPRTVESLQATAAPDPAVLGGVVRLTATLGDPLDTGRVVWGGAGGAGAVLPARTCRPVAGACAVTWRPGSAGAWTVVATWSGDRGHLPASTSRDLTVRRVPVALRLAAAPRPLPSGHALTLAADLQPPVDGGVVTVTASGPTATGLPAGSCVPAGGRCTLTFQPPAPGTWSLTASWPGDQRHRPATGDVSVAVEPQPVERQPVALSLSADPDPATLGQAMTLTASLDQAVSDGTILFSGTGPGGAALGDGTCAPVSGVCTWTAHLPAAGTWQVRAAWSGDARWAPAQTAATVTVEAPPPAAYTYGGLWQGRSVTLTHVPNVTVEGLADAHLLGELSDFQTDDPAYRCLAGASINVWTAPAEFPGRLVVHNGLQGSQCTYGTWTFAG